MNCRSAESLFSAFLDDELNQAERRNFESHLLGCRRCSQSLRELKGAMALVLDASVATMAETNPHFEDDLMDRIRSGEAMRPTVIEWLHGLLMPQAFRPVFVAGVSACAVLVAAMVFHVGPFQGSTNPGTTGVAANGAAVPNGATPAPLSLGPQRAGLRDSLPVQLLEMHGRAERGVVMHRLVSSPL